ncbi:MAG TPA: flagellar protein FliT [Pseudomonadales bacterium]|nr:flagellar protein FliT [Pseudomonadales bacterium]
MTETISLTQLHSLTADLLAAFDNGDWEQAQALQLKRSEHIRDLVMRAQTTLTPQQLAEMIQALQRIEADVAQRSQALQAEVQQKVSAASKQRHAISKYQQQK